MKVPFQCVRSRAFLSDRILRLARNLTNNTVVLSCVNIAAFVWFIIFS